MFFPDLSAKTYIGEASFLRSVGWLSNEHKYRKGRVSDSFLELLKKHVDNAWVPFACAGMHDCELCRGAKSRYSDSRNFFIPGKNDIVYISNGMIIHYIKEHNYQPPIEFIDAVYASPNQGSEEFLNKLQIFAIWWDLQFD